MMASNIQVLLQTAIAVVKNAKIDSSMSVCLIYNRLRDPKALYNTESLAKDLN